jgi:subtilisin family serine protease
VLAVAAVAAALALPAGAAAGPPTGRVLVLLHRGGDARAQAAGVRGFLARSGARPAGPTVPQIGLVTVRRPRGVTLARLAARLRRDPAVVSVQAEHRATLRANPGDPALSAQDPRAPAGTSVQWNLVREDFPAAWDIARGDGAVVGVIDTGIDAVHPELAGKIASTGDHDDNPGDGPATTDEVGHGTHVASLACAATGDAAGMAGSGYDCRLVVEKSDLTDASIAASIVEATDRGSDSINMSFGDDGARPPAQAVVDAIRYAIDRKVVLVAAASDEDVEEQGSPANVLQPTGTGPDLTQGAGLVVTASDANDARATFGSDPSGQPLRPGRGTQISLAAYGAYGPSGPPGIFGAFPAQTTQIETGTVDPPSAPCLDCRTTFNGDNRYAYLSGTSMSAPQVAAVAALVRHLNPDLTLGQILTILKQSARRPAGGGWTPDLGWGILDAGAALDSARRVDVRAPTSRLRAPRRSRRAVIRLRWSGSDPAPTGLIASGIARYQIYAVSGGHTRRIASTRKRSMRFRGRPGRRYRFYSVAVDRAGNREASPRRSSTRILRARR